MMTITQVNITISYLKIDFLFISLMVHEAPYIKGRQAAAEIVEENYSIEYLRFDLNAWEGVLLFSYKALYTPPLSYAISLVSQVKNTISTFSMTRVSIFELSIKDDLIKRVVN